jgi:hypothetical protein
VSIDADPGAEDAPPDDAPFQVRLRTGEAVVAGLLLLVAIAAGVMASRLPLGTPRLPNAGFFPLLAASGMALSAIAVLISSVLRRAPGIEHLVPIGHVQGVLLILGLLSVAIGFERAGFAVLWPACTLLLFVLTSLGWLRSGLVAAAFVGGAYLVFARLLGLQLPPFVNL